MKKYEFKKSKTALFEAPPVNLHLNTYLLIY